MYPDLPIMNVPRERNAPIGNVLQVYLDGASTTSVQLSVTTQAARPAASFTAWPGPNNPQTPGTYLVLATNGTETDSVAWLTVY